MKGRLARFGSETDLPGGKTEEDTIKYQPQKRQQALEGEVDRRATANADAIREYGRVIKKQEENLQQSQFAGGNNDRMLIVKYSVPEMPGHFRIMR